MVLGVSPEGAGEESRTVGLGAGGLFGRLGLSMRSGQVVVEGTFVCFVCGGGGAGRGRGHGTPGHAGASAGKCSPLVQTTPASLSCLQLLFSQPRDLQSASEASVPMHWTSSSMMGPDPVDTADGRAGGVMTAPRSPTARLSPLFRAPAVRVRLRTGPSPANHGGYSSKGWVCDCNVRP